MNGDLVNQYALSSTKSLLGMLWITISGRTHWVKHAKIEPPYACTLLAQAILPLQMISW
jgi:hypothetical protein